MGMDGLQVVAAAQQRQLDLAIIILTGHGSLDTTVEGLHHGIFDYLLKTAVWVALPLLVDGWRGRYRVRLRFIPRSCGRANFSTVAGGHGPAGAESYWRAAPCRRRCRAPSAAAR